MVRKIWAIIARRKMKKVNGAAFMERYGTIMRRFERESRKWDEPLKAVSATPRFRVVCKNPAIAAAISSRLI